MNTNPYKKYPCPHCGAILKLMMNIKNRGFYNLPYYFYKCESCGLRTHQEPYLNKLQRSLEI